MSKLRTPYHSANVSPDAAAWNGLALLLGPRQADVMQLFWTYGPATAREIHTRLAVESPLAYTTVMSTCVRLTEKGLLERQRLDGDERGTPIGHPYRYAPVISEDAFIRTAVAARLAALQEHFPALFDAPAGPRVRANAQTDRPQIERLLAYLGRLQQVDGGAADDAALDQIVALLERAEAAEGKAAAWQVRHGRPSSGSQRPNGVCSA